MLDTRKSGVLMSISSLPSEYGVGTFGDGAVDFARRIADMGFSYWQVLPFTPLDYANSPYGSDSAFAGNELYISPDLMARDGFITEREAVSSRYRGTPFTADYDYARANRERLIRLAFSRLDSATLERVDEFITSRDLTAHCIYRALKREHGGAPFWEWKRGKTLASALGLAEELQDEIRFHGFVQYLFFLQWESTKAKINALGVKIIGDMPIYVSRDSVDLWANPELFEVAPESFSPARVAGVPPDYFSEDGQLWGNPLYNWKAHKKQGYAWWLRRIKASFSIYDMLRIDHFRAFASYYAVDADAENAKEGVWEKGPRMALFNAVKQELGELPIIAEDLGSFGQDVLDLLEKSKFPGMRIIQFGFDPYGDSTHLPHNYPANSIAYVGTHDNNTLLGWLWEAGEEERKFALDYCGYVGSDWGRGSYDAPACRKVIEAVWRSNSKLAIIPFQDMCGFGSDARMNIPGDDNGNWRYRTNADTISGIDTEYFKNLNRTFRRC